MPKYKVTFELSEVYYMDVEVDAPDEYAAEELASDKLDDYQYPSSPHWTIRKGYGGVDPIRTYKVED